MKFEEKKAMLDGYDFSDGFILAEDILSDPRCTLETALGIFYSAGGADFLKDPSGHSGGDARWLYFMSVLKKDIETGTFPKGGGSYRIPLRPNRRAALKKMRTPRVFLEDIRGKEEEG